METQSDAVPLSAGRRPDWFTRNWKWVVPIGCLGLVVLIAMFVGAIFSIVEYSFQHSDAYNNAIALARSNPAVSGKIGQPLKIGWFASGNINISGPSGDADLAIPISGPHGKGTIYAVAKKSAGVWRFEILQVEIAGEPQRIDLLLQEQKAPVE